MLGKVEVTLQSCGRLLMGRDNGERKPIKDPNSPENKAKEFHDAQYLDRKGNLCLWSEHLEKCFEVAGKQVPFKGKQNHSKLLCGGIYIEPQEIPLKKAVAIPFPKMVRIPPKTGARVLKTRAIVNAWEATFEINVVNDDINFDALKEVVSKAGIHCGLLAWRPKFGRFEIKKFKKVGEK
jgi:hypothetical protein